MPTIAAWLVISCTLIAFVWLIPAGRWGADEFFLSSTAREVGWIIVKVRLLWGPRPVSEALLAIYLLLCSAFRQSLIVPILAFLWLALAWAMGRALRGAWSMATSLATAAVAALFLAGHPVGEMFYTPIVAVAYIPTLAAAAFIVIRSVLSSRIGPWELGAALVVCAWSSEAGAVVVVCIAPVLFIKQGLAGRYACVVGLVCSACVFVALSGHRGLHRPVGLVDGLGSALTRIGPDFASVDGSTTIAAVLVGLTVKLLFCIGARLTCRPAFRPGLAVGVGASCMLIELAAIIAGEDHCCGRYETLRQCLYFLALLAVCGTNSRGAMPPLSRSLAPGQAGPAMLCVSVAIALAWRMPDLAADFSHRDALIEATSRTWQSGMAPADDMVFKVGPPTKVVGMTSTWPRGKFGTDQPHWVIESVLHYFHKRTVFFKP